MINYRNLLIYLIPILIFILFLVHNCSKNNVIDGNVVTVNGKKYQSIKTIIDTQYITKNQVVYKEGKTIFRDKPIYVEIPSNIDTVKILKDFYSKVVYKDTLKLQDKLGFITINDTIYKNGILNRVWNANIKQLIVNKTEIVKELPKNKISVGGIGGVVMNKPYIGPSILFSSKKDVVYGVSIGFGFNNLNIYQVSIHKTLNFKK